ncbi:MAG: hypothetical protein R3F50_18920 [Gammaproteobacteria bacterium]
MTDYRKIDSNEDNSTPQPVTGISPPKCDIEKYREHVQSFDLSPEEEAELLKNLWLIMAAFVDLGFGVDSIQFLSASEKGQGLNSPSCTKEQDQRLALNGGIHDK